MARQAAFKCGNAHRDMKRGWFIGQFVPEQQGLHHRHDVEVKWGHHPAGDRRGAWGKNRLSTTISILLEGTFVIYLRHGDGEHEVRLAERGDYVIIAPEVMHRWEALTESLVLTVRCPSIAEDQANVAE